MSRLRDHWITILLLAPACGFALIVGVHDAALADELGTRTIGAGLAALGLVLIYCITTLIERDHDAAVDAPEDSDRGVLLRRERADSKTADANDADAIGMFGCLIVTAISGYLVAAQVLGRYLGFIWPFVQLAVFAAWFIASLVGVRHLWRRQRERGQKPRFRQFPVLGSAVSLGLVVGVVQFWYTNVYVPASAEPSLSITPSMGAVSVRSTTVGPRLLVSPRIGLEKAMRGGPPATLQGQQDRALVGFGKFLQQGQLLNAGETDHQFAVAILKPQSFDMASIAIFVVLARPTLHLGETAMQVPRPGPRQGAASKLPPDKPCAHLDPSVEPSFANPPASLIYTSEIQENSWLHRLARGRQYLRIRYSTFSGAQPVTIGVSRHRYRPSSPGYNEAMSRLYGVTYDVARASAILPTDVP